MKEKPDTHPNAFLLNRYLRDLISYIWTTDMDWTSDWDRGLGEIEEEVLHNSGLLQQDAEGKFFCGKEDVIDWMVKHMIDS